MCNLGAVVCLWGGERGTCLGPFFGTPEVLRAKNFLVSGEKRIIHSYNVRQSRSKAVTLHSKASSQKLLYAGTVLSKGPPTAIEMCKCSAFKLYWRGPQQQLLCVSTLLLIGIRFHVTLRFLRPEICKHLLAGKWWRPKARKEKASKLKTKMIKSKQKPQQVKSRK